MSDFSFIKKNKQIIPLLFLSACCVNVLLHMITGAVVFQRHLIPFIPDKRHYYAFAAVALNIIIYFTWPKAFSFIFIPTLIAGIYNLIYFTPLIIVFSITFDNLHVNFQPAALLAALFAYLVNFKQVNDAVLEALARKRTPEEWDKYEKEQYEEAIETFMERYDKYSNERLNEIIAENKFVPEALEAARRLLAERGITPEINNKGEITA